MKLSVFPANRWWSPANQVGIFLRQFGLSQPRINLLEQRVKLQIDNYVRRIFNAGSFLGVGPRLLVILHPQIELGAFVPRRPHLRSKLS